MKTPPNRNLFRNQSSTIYKKTNKTGIEDESVKKIFLEIKKKYKNILKDSNNIKKVNNKKVDFPSNNNILLLNRLKKFSPKKISENSLSFKLSNKINKEALIIELRRELDYHIKFNSIYSNYYSRIIHLKDIVKDNMEKVQQKTDSLKVEFKDRFMMITQFEKTIELLKVSKTEMIKTNTDILKVKEDNKKKLSEKFDIIQEQNSAQSKKIEELQKKISLLEYQKTHIIEELEAQLKKDEENYKINLKLYDNLLRKYNYFFDEYNSFVKTGDEITKEEVKLFDDTNVKNYIIEENLEIKLGENMIKKNNLNKNLVKLKMQIKILEDKIKEDKEKEGQKTFREALGFSLKKKININSKLRNFNNNNKFQKLRQNQSAIYKNKINFV